MSTEVRNLFNDELVIDECDHLSLKAHTGFQLWLKTIIDYITSRVSQSSPRFRMYGYEHGASTVVALDILTGQADKDVSITIQILPGRAILTRPVDDQLDFVLPSVVSIFDFMNSVATGHTIPPYIYLEMSPWVEQS